jgi:hypothetical protein
MATEQFSNFIEGEAGEQIDDTQTQITVENSSVFPDPRNGHYHLVIWDADTYATPHRDDNAEIVAVTGYDIQNNTITVERGKEDTTAESHPDSSKCTLVTTAAALSDFVSRSGNTNSTSSITADAFEFDQTKLQFENLSTFADADIIGVPDNKQNQTANGSFGLGFGLKDYSNSTISGFGFVATLDNNKNIDGTSLFINSQSVVLGTSVSDFNIYDADITSSSGVVEQSTLGGPASSLSSYPLSAQDISEDVIDEHLKNTVSGNESGTVKDGNSATLCADVLSNGETLSIVKATLARPDLQEFANGGGGVDMQLVTFDGNGSYVVESPILLGSGAPHVGSTVGWSYQNTTGSGQYVGVVVENTSGSDADVFASVEGSIK